MRFSSESMRHVGGCRRDTPTHRSVSSARPVAAAEHFATGGAASSTSDAARTAGWLVLSRLVLAAAAAVAGLVAAAELGPSGRGEVAIGLLIGYAGAVVGILGLENTLVAVAPGRTFADSYGLSVAFARRSLPIALVITAVGAIVGQSSGWFRWDAAFAVLGVGVGTAAVRLASTAGASAGDSRRQTSIALISGISLVGGAAALWAVGGSTSGEWLWLYSLSTLAGVFGARLPRTRAIDAAERLVDLRRATVPALAATVTNFLTLRADRLLLPLLTDTRQLGVYVVASTVVDVVTLPAKSGSQVLAARWGLTGPPSLVRTFSASAAGAALPAVALVVFGQALLPRVLGEAYADSGDLLLILGPAIVCYLVTRTIHARQLSLGNQWAVSTSETAGFVVAIATYLVAIPFLGATGAALGSLAGYATSMIVGVALSLSNGRSAD